MSRSESADRRALLAGLRAAGLDACAVESDVSSGLPDVNYGGFTRWGARSGWIECKKLDRWPAKAETPVRIDHPDRFLKQTAWMARRWRAGGAAHLWLRVDRSYYLLDAPTARDLALGKLLAIDVATRALACWLIDPVDYERVALLLAWRR